MSLADSTSIKALNESSITESLVINAANSINWDIGLFHIIDECIENSINSNISEVVERGKETKGTKVWRDNFVIYSAITV